MICPKCTTKMEYHGEGFSGETSCTCPFYSDARVEDIGPHFYCRECGCKLVLQWYLTEPEVVI